MEIFLFLCIRTRYEEIEGGCTTLAYFYRHLLKTRVAEVWSLEGYHVSYGHEGYRSFSMITLAYFSAQLGHSDREGRSVSWNGIFGCR